MLKSKNQHIFPVPEEPYPGGEKECEQDGADDSVILNDAAGMFGDGGSTAAADEEWVQYQCKRIGDRQPPEKEGQGGFPGFGDSDGHRVLLSVFVFRGKSFLYRIHAGIISARFSTNAMPQTTSPGGP